MVPRPDLPTIRALSTSGPPHKVRRERLSQLAGTLPVMIKPLVGVVMAKHHRHRLGVNAADFGVAATLAEASGVGDTMFSAPTADKLKFK